MPLKYKSKKMIAQEFAQALKDRFQGRIVKTILYGSVGRGEETGESDIDVLVIAREREEVFSGLPEILSEFILKYDILPEVILLSEDEFMDIQRRKTPYYRSIETEGVAVG